MSDSPDSPSSKPSYRRITDQFDLPETYEPLGPGHISFEADLATQTTSNVTPSLPAASATSASTSTSLKSSFRTPPPKKQATTSSQTTTSSSAPKSAPSTGTTSSAATAATSVSGVPPPPPPPPAPKKKMTSVNVGSFTLTPINKANTQVEPTTVHKKATRSSLSEDERVRLFHLASGKMKQGVFKPLPIEISDPKQLSDYHSLDTLIKLFSEHCETYDMVDVFTILVPLDPQRPDLKQDGTGAPITYNLLSEYSTVTVQQVAAHCNWLHSWTDNSVDQMHTNLQWSYHFLKNNIEPELMSRLQQRYEKYTKLEQGGPLLFSLLLAELLYTNESSIKALVTQIEKYKISSLPNENVKVASAIILSVSRRIWFSKKQKFPDRYIDTIFGVYQTTSVPDFNSQFKLIASQRTREETEASVAIYQGVAATTVSMSFDNDLPSVEKIVAMGNRFYDEYSRKEVWSTHVKGSKPRAAAMVAAAPKCFNCNGAHHVKECPDKIDNARIERNKKQFLQDKRSRRMALTAMVIRKPMETPIKMDATLVVPTIVPPLGPTPPTLPPITMVTVVMIIAFVLLTMTRKRIDLSTPALMDCNPTSGMPPPVAGTSWTALVLMLHLQPLRLFLPPPNSRSTLLLLAQPNLSVLRLRKCNNSFNLLSTRSEWSGGNCSFFF